MLDVQELISGVIIRRGDRARGLTLEDSMTQKAWADRFLGACPH